MFTPEGLLYLSLTAWLILDVEAYKSGCSGGYCFVVTDIQNDNERLYQSNAQQWCQSNRSQLVEIRNNDIQSQLVNFLKSVYLNNWNVITFGKRSSGNWIRLNDNGIGDLSFYDQRDSSYAYGYLMSATSGFNLFASRPADKKGGFICSGLSDCSSGVTISGQCYRSFPETLSWYDARNRCLDGGGDLATFDHITTNAGFNALNGSWISASNSYWIGIRREWWIWQSTNSDIKHTEWKNGNPINYYADTDCLCWSTTESKWTECGCNQRLPFICISDNNSITSTTTTTSTKTTTTTTPTTTSTATSTTTRSTTSTGWPTATASSISTSSVASESGGVQTPTNPSNFTTAGNNTVIEQSTGLSQEAAIGIGVGVGVGGALVIIALIAAVIILCRKRCPLRCPQWKKTNAKGQPPDILMKDSVNNSHTSDGIENPYARVVSSSPEWNDADTNAYENSSQTPTVYAELGFCTEPRIHRPGSVIIVPGKTKPATLPRPPNNNDATSHFNVGGDLYAEVTKA